MPSSYQIRLSNRAAADLNGIFDYIAVRSPQNAARVIARILASIELLKTLPHRTIVKTQSVERKVRSLPVQSWIVYFEVEVIG